MANNLVFILLEETIFRMSITVKNSRISYAISLRIVGSWKSCIFRFLHNAIYNNVSDINRVRFNGKTNQFA